MGAQTGREGDQGGLPEAGTGGREPGRRAEVRKACSRVGRVYPEAKEQIMGQRHPVAVGPALSGAEHPGGLRAGWRGHLPFGKPSPGHPRGTTSACLIGANSFFQ